MFTRKDEILRIESKSDITNIIDFLKGFSLKDFDCKSDHEILSVCIYFIGLYKISKLSTPIFVLKREAPDYQISLIKNKAILGIEHSRATIEEYLIAEKELNNRPNGSMIELCHYSPFRKLPKKKSFIGIKDPGEELNGLGWRGNLMEMEWAEIIYNTLIEKSKLLNKEHFHKFQYNELIIEDCSHVELFRELDIGIKYLQKLYNKTNWDIYNYKFDKVHIFSCNDFVYDVFKENIKVDMQKKSL